MTADASYHLETLERRWQLEKTPQLGLRLAEEYRRKGDLSASIEVLADGLEVYPTHTASHVALSRYLVDGERFDEAVSHLEEIVRLDPAHLVANKLLVGAYAGIGRLDDARDKLDIYEMMAEGDADIEGLRRLVEPSKTDDLASTAHGTVADSEKATAETAAPEHADAGIWPGDEEPTTKTGAQEPFGSTWSDDESPSYWQEVADEGIFDFETPPLPGGDGSAAQAELEEPSPRAAPDSTVTMGRLYLEQGHRQEAAEAFQNVLRREPDNEVAQRGLDRAVEEQGAGVGGSGVEEEEPMASALERKKSVLTAYLTQIRRAVESGV